MSEKNNIQIRYINKIKKRKFYIKQRFYLWLNNWCLNILSFIFLPYILDLFWYNMDSYLEVWVCAVLSSILLAIKFIIKEDNINNFLKKWYSTIIIMIVTLFIMYDYSPWKKTHY